MHHELAAGEALERRAAKQRDELLVERAVQRRDLAHSSRNTPTTRPAEEPGTPLEPPGNRRPREMVTLDRIRLTGLLRQAPAHAGVFYFRYLR